MKWDYEQIYRRKFEKDCPSGYNCWREFVMMKRRGDGSYQVTKAIRTGLLKPVHECVCVDCGSPAECYDHRDYNKPLAVDPVCKRCDSLRGPGAPFLEEGSKGYRELLKEIKRAVKNGERKINHLTRQRAQQIAAAHKPK